MTDRGRRITVDRSRDGEMGAYFSGAVSPRRGGIVLVQEIFGVTQAIRDIADDLAGEGYDVLAPDLFWRLEPGVELGNGEDPALRVRAIDLLNRFDVEAGVADLSAAADKLRTMLPADRSVCIVGFCIGGRMAGLVAGGGHVDAAVSFYGVGLDRYLDRIAAIAIPTAFHIGDMDTHIPPESVERLRTTISAASNPDLTMTLYPDAGHAFYNRHRLDLFQPEAAKVARTNLLAFLARYLNSTNAQARP